MPSPGSPGSRPAAVKKSTPAPDLEKAARKAAKKAAQEKAAAEAAKAAKAAAESDVDDDHVADASDDETADAPKQAMQSDGSDDEDTGQKNKAGDDVSDDDEEGVDTDAPRVVQSFDANTICESYFLSYGKKVFGIPDDAFVLVGTPFECADGAEMGRMLASKSCDEWARLKPRNVFILHADDTDFLYVAAFVPGSPTEAVDRKRLHPIHRPVCNHGSHSARTRHCTSAPRPLFSRSRFALFVYAGVPWPR